MMRFIRNAAWSRALPLLAIAACAACGDDPHAQRDAARRADLHAAARLQATRACEEALAAMHIELENAEAAAASYRNEASIDDDLARRARTEVDRQSLERHSRRWTRRADEAEANAALIGVRIRGKEAECEEARATHERARREADRLAAALR